MLLDKLAEQKRRKEFVRATLTANIVHRATTDIYQKESDYKHLVEKLLTEYQRPATIKKKV